MLMLIMPEKVRARRKAVMNDLLEAIVDRSAIMKKRYCYVRKWYVFCLRLYERLKDIYRACYGFS